MAARSYAFAGTTMSILVGGDATNGKFAIMHVTKPTGSSTPLHSHDEETELVYALRGTIGAETEGRITRYNSRQPVILPPGRPHRLFNDSKATAYEFLLSTPAIFDRFVAAVGTEVEAGSAPVAMTDEERHWLVDTAPRFGIRLLPPAALSGPTHEAPEQAFESIDVMGTRVEVIARLGRHDADLVLLRQSVHPGWSVPLHSHAEPECCFITSGTLDLYLEDKGWVKLDAEQAEYVGPDIRHAIRNTGDIPADMLMVTTVRMARFLATIGAPATATDPRPPTPAELAAFPNHVRDYGYWVASPGETASIGL